MRHFGSLKVTRQAVEPVWHFTPGWKRRPRAGRKALGIRNKIVLYTQDSAYAIKWPVQAGIASSYSSISVNSGSWWWTGSAAIHGVPESRTQLSGWSDLIWSDSSIWASQVVLVVKNLPANARDIRDTGSFPGLGGSPGRGHGTHSSYSCLENPMDRGTCWAMVHRITQSWTRLKQLSMYVLL